MKKMREISPAENDPTCEKYINAHPDIRNWIESIRDQKKRSNRPNPSLILIDKSTILTLQKRKRLLDKIATLTDENLTGRSDMCKQFALLLTLGLNHLGFKTRFVSGKATYIGKTKFEWEHAWVRTENKEVVDGNIDAVTENPLFPKTLNPKPYWGPIRLTPKDRFLKENKSLSNFDDQDVKNIWWPDLKKYIDKEL